MRSALVPILLNSVPGWVRSSYGLLRPAAVMHFDEGRAWVPGASGNVDPASFLAAVRASNETTLLPSSASGASYLTFGSNTPAIAPGFGLQSFEAATNLLLNSTAPVTQTTASLGTGTYTLWVNGSGTATPSGGTATITGAAAASNGSPNTFTVTVAGTVIVTKAGSLNAFQLQAGPIGTALVVTGGVTATQATDALTLVGPALAAASQTTFSVFAQTLGLAASANNAVILGQNGADRAFLYADHVSGSTSLGSYDGTNLLTTGNGAAFTSTTVPVRGATAVSASARTLCVSGGTVVSQTNLFAATTSVTVGNNGGLTRAMNGYLQRLAIFPTALSNAQLQAIAT